MRPALLNFSAFLIAVAGTLAYLPLFTDASLYTKLAAFSILSPVMIALHYKQILRSIIGAAIFSRNGILLGILILGCLPGIMKSEFILEGLERLGVLLLMGFYFLIASSFERTKRFEWIGLISFFSLSIITIWGYVDFFFALNGFELTHQSSYEISASMGHRNLLAQAIWLLIPGVLILLKYRPSLQLFIRISIFLSALLSVMMLSRGGWIAALMALSVAIWYKTKTRFKFSRKLLLALGYGIVSIILFFAFVSDGIVTISHHFETLFEFSEGTTRDRVLLLERSVKLFIENPVSGVGAGNWPIEIMKFDQTGMLTSDGSVMYQRPHNDFVWVLSEYGIIAGVSYALLLCINLFQSFRKARSSNELNRYAMFTFWLVFMLTSMSNFPLERPFLMVLLSLYLAADFDRALRLKSSNWKGLFLGLFSLLPMVLVYPVVKGSWAMNNAIKAQLENDAYSYKNWLLKASDFGVSKDDFNATIDWHLGNTENMLGNQDQALKHYLKAIETNPYHPYALNSAGSLLAQKLESGGAELYFKAAIDHAPTYADAWLNLALLQYSQNRNEEAMNSFLSADPHSENGLYVPLGTRIAIEQLNLMIPHFPERKLWKTLEAIRNTPTWAFNTMHHAAVNGYDFEHQALMDAIFYMITHCDSQEECAECEAIRLKYIPHQKLNLPEE